MAFPSDSITIKTTENVEIFFKDILMDGEGLNNKTMILVNNENGVPVEHYVNTLIFNSTKMEYLVAKKKERE